MIPARILLATLSLAQATLAQDNTIRFFPVDGEVRQATVERNRVYVAAGNKGFQILDLTLGKVIRTTVLPGRSVTAFALGEGRAFLLSRGANTAPAIHSVWLKDGSLERTVSLRAQPLLGIAVVGEEIVVVGDAVTLHENRALTPLRTIPLQEDGAARAFAIRGTTMFVARSYPGELTAIDLRTGERIFKSVRREVWLEQVAVLGQTVFVADRTTVEHIDLRTGERRMVHSGYGRLCSSGRNVILQTRAALLFFDATGSLVANRPLPKWLRKRRVRIEQLLDESTALFSMRGGLALLKLAPVQARPRRRVF